MIRYFIISISFLLCSSWLTAQDLPSEIADQIESFLEEQDEELDILLLYELLTAYHEKPLNINKAQFDELKELRLLSDIQINDLLNHIEQYGDLIAIEELQAIASFTVADIRRIQSFVEVKDPLQLNIGIGEMITESRNELFFKYSQFLETKQGFIEDDQGEKNYVGGKGRYFTRWRSNYENKLQLGVILESDSGEAFMQDPENLGFDYLSFHAYLRDYNKFFKEIALGDYSISLGQGLIAHNSFGAGKSAWVTNIKKGGRVLRPYSSVNENGYMRGAAVTMRPVKDIEWSVFLSSVMRDGNVLAEDTLPNGEPNLLFSSLQTSGNHRTQSEIADKDVIGLKSIGTSIKLKKRRLKLGLNSFNHFFDGTLMRQDDLYNLFRFQNDRLFNHSIDYSYRLNNFNFFGEWAYSSTGGFAKLFGLLVGLDRKSSLAILFRDYDRDYNALQPNAFGESSTINNESGVYIGYEYLISKNWKLSAYADVWKHPWLRFGVNSPSHGKEYIGRLDYIVKRKLSAYIQYTFEEKETNLISDSDVITKVENQVRHRLRFHFNNKLNRSLELRTRLELSKFQNPDESQHGILIFQDFIYRSISSPLSLTARIALFDTDGFDSRIFAYENSVLYEFSIPSYFDQGFRYYLNLRYDLTRKLTGELRIARTHLTNEDSFSSGNEFIDDDTKTELKLQLRYQF